ncbi:hypothetical protein DFJ73DRAFT_780574 [Zopfochytrium polystomum]|nr:hypothetical protein DFJ73DRAFT_780574 [Zopfochytrium polystomum]
MKEQDSAGLAGSSVDAMFFFAFYAYTIMSLIGSSGRRHLYHEGKAPKEGDENDSHEEGDEDEENIESRFILWSRMPVPNYRYYKAASTGGMNDSGAVRSALRDGAIIRAVQSGDAKLARIRSSWMRLFFGPIYYGEMWLRVRKAEPPVDPVAAAKKLFSAEGKKDRYRRWMLVPNYRYCNAVSTGGVND